MGKVLVSSEEVSEKAEDIMDVASAISPVGAVLNALTSEPDEVEEDKEGEDKEDEDMHAFYMSKYAEDLQQTDKMQKDYEQRNMEAENEMSVPKALRRYQ